MEVVKWIILTVFCLLMTGSHAEYVVKEELLVCDFSIDLCGWDDTGVTKCHINSSNLVEEISSSSGCQEFVLCSETRESITSSLRSPQITNEYPYLNMTFWLWVADDVICSIDHKAEEGRIQPVWSSQQGAKVQSSTWNWIEDVLESSAFLSKTFQLQLAFRSLVERFDRMAAVCEFRLEGMVEVTTTVKPDTTTGDVTEFPSTTEATSTVGPDKTTPDNTTETTTIALETTTETTTIALKTTTETTIIALETTTDVHNTIPDSTTDTETTTTQCTTEFVTTVMESTTEPHAESTTETQTNIPEKTTEAQTTTMETTILVISTTDTTESKCTTTTKLDFTTEDTSVEITTELTKDIDATTETCTDDDCVSTKIPIVRAILVEESWFISLMVLSGLVAIFIFALFYCRIVRKNKSRKGKYDVTELYVVTPKP